MEGVDLRYRNLAGADLSGAQVPTTAPPTLHPAIPSLWYEGRHHSSTHHPFNTSPAPLTFSTFSPFCCQKLADRSRGGSAGSNVSTPSTRWLMEGVDLRNRNLAGADLTGAQVLHPPHLAEHLNLISLGI